MSKRKRGKPTGGGGAKHPNSLANLRPGAGRAGSGNTRRTEHGGYAVVARERLEAREREVADALSADAPLRNADGSLPAADAVLVHLLAQALCRLEDVAAHLRDRGLLDADGEMRAAVEVEAKLRREAADHAEALGMSPRARAKIGLDMLRAEREVEDSRADRETRERLDRRLEALDGESEAGEVA